MWYGQPPNNTLERTVNPGGRIVLAMDCVLADAQWQGWPAAQLGRWADRSTIEFHGAARSAVRSDRPLAGGLPRGIEVGTNDPGGRPPDRRLHPCPKLAPRVTRSSSSCSNVSPIA